MVIILLFQGMSDIMQFHFFHSFNRASSKEIKLKQTCCKEIQTETEIEVVSKNIKTKEKQLAIAIKQTKSHGLQKVLKLMATKEYAFARRELLQELGLQSANDTLGDLLYNEKTSSSCWLLADRNSKEKLNKVFLLSLAKVLFLTITIFKRTYK